MTYAGRWYHQRKKKGLCPYCPKKAVPGKVSCEDCLDKRAEYARAHRKVEPIPICGRCGRRRVMNDPVEVWCSLCLEEYPVEWVKEKHQRTQKKNRRYYQKRKRRLVEAV